MPQTMTHEEIEAALEKGVEAAKVKGSPAGDLVYLRSKVMDGDGVIHLLQVAFPDDGPAVDLAVALAELGKIGELKAAVLHGSQKQPSGAFASSLDVAGVARDGTPFRVLFWVTPSRAVAGDDRPAGGP